MRLSNLLLALSLAYSVASIITPEEFHKYKLKPKRAPLTGPTLAPRSDKEHTYLNAHTEKYAVNSTGVPLVNFDIGESYAGTLPITSNASDTNRLFFWFFPTSNPAGKKEITIWLNGGPGCSSLDGFLQENGPILWQSGTYEPVPNPYTWVNLTNMVWVDQPVGVGYSPGKADVNSETDVAVQFMGFWKNFIELFHMEGYKVFIAGESYAGQYVPFIASGMLDAKNETYYDVKGITIIDPVMAGFSLQQQAPTVPFVLANNNILNLNQSFIDDITKRADSCGLTKIFNTYTTTFPPPPGPIPLPDTLHEPGCETIWDDVYTAAFYINPCFNLYHIIDFCPYLNDELGFPSLGVGPNNYFNRSDVKIALHVAVDTDYAVCGTSAGDPGLFDNGDNSDFSSVAAIPSVIDRTGNVIIAHGMLDFLLIANGSLISIQNMTWNGQQGFQTSPSAVNNFYVPYHYGSAEAAEVSTGTWTNDAGAGILGKTHEERGLTFVTINLAGHEIPQYSPGAAYRMVEKMLGRIPSLEYVSDYTTQNGNFTGTSA